jgi:hypothetical protein
MGLALAAAACRGGDGDVGPANPAADRTVPIDSRVPASLTDLAGNPPDDFPPGALRDVVASQLTTPDVASRDGEVAVQVAFGQPVAGARLEVAVPDDGFDEQSGAGGECVGLTPDSTVGRVAVASQGVDDGALEAAQVLVGGPLRGGQLHTGSLVFALAGRAADGGTIEVRLDDDLRSGTFIGTDTAGRLLAGRFDCIAAGAGEPVVEVSRRALGTLDVTVEVTTPGAATSGALSADATSLATASVTPDGDAYCSGVVGFDEPYVVRLGGVAVARADAMTSISVRTDAPTRQRETTPGSLEVVVDGEEYVVEAATISISTDGLGGVFEGVTAGGAAVSGTWLCG